MRRFYISSEKFTGSGEIVYNEEGCLVFFDFRGTSVSPAGMVQLVKTVIPVNINSLELQFQAFPVLVCIEAEFSVTLEDFKREYPYARNMHILPEIWDRMSKTNQVLAWKAAQDYRKYCERNSGWYKPKIAASWLKAKEYLNDWKKL
ncbi:hypothetical protein SAMN05428988_1331 [Chitinophaga sp. YR573]|uniref:hypothetical protein n=1 Tax=Chitinophaga sp. YR573 TaxID=1881040 RepID=UPI0008B9C80C|nr:hypothetical protein [Chitinophaga sp. YR573]SEW02126.1 hypothetical protein SAMN05428988_1331 [Chitinophaga sp. YR573]